MKKQFITIIKNGLFAASMSALLMLNVATTQAQEASDKPSMSFSVGLNSDIFFGFYPAFAGTYNLSDKIGLTTYGILWSGGGLGQTFGNWTEFGVGVNFTPMEGLSINPQLGILNGSLLSGVGQSVLAEGIVPNITIRENTDKIEGELYAGYYYGLDHGNPTTNNYLHWWANGGYKVLPYFSVGAHFEHLRYTGGKDVPSDAASDLYMALGAYVQFMDPQGKAFTRFVAAGDLRSDEEVTKSGVTQPSFFKLTVGFNF